jgi:hypothetical protein
MKKYNNIHIAGKRWFQRTYGNTYHSTTVYVDGESIGTSPREYGYGEQYVQTGFEMLQAAGYYPKTGKRLASGLGADYYKFIEDRRKHDGRIICTVADVARERDL